MTFKYDFRQVDAWKDEMDCWTWNESFHLEDVVIEDGKEEEFLLSNIIQQYRDKYELTYDGNVFELCLKDEGMRPIFALIPSEG